jgi:hypothetical protein
LAVIRRPRVPVIELHTATRQIIAIVSAASRLETVFLDPVPVGRQAHVGILCLIQALKVVLDLWV